MSTLILLSNDDGVHARGLSALRAALLPLGRVVVVAPDRPRSASGHSITLHKPLRIHKVDMPQGGEWYSTTGTPSDCILLAVHEILHRPPDLVVSGINDGPNLGWDLTYSGTVAAAMEGAIIGAQALAVSLVNTGCHPKPGFSAAAAFAFQTASLLLSNPLPPHALLNINVPMPPDMHIRGAVITHQGVRRYPGRIEKRTDPSGRTYYWLGGDVPEDRMDPGSDVEAVANGFISVTPIHLDLTSYSLLAQLKEDPNFNALLHCFASAHLDQGGR
ncbi:MAG: 5'/3'-nucleotidase SurE [Armatimonadota bacterium]